ncbi:phosphotransferase [Microlunatus parietis]|uniref:Aminoglycoside phosphotransferase domain-containing protein n=1 Tax=Microlunatus parietis TaxID=682979 RepID=A0A7Y9IAC8_9ACTN|nr:phosphotransferase [Microlunatus parietis]NYE73256.1 hypothetical protein [Microlunatus parietis]
MPLHPLDPVRRARVLDRLSRLAGETVRAQGEEYVGHVAAPVTRLILDRELPGIGRSVMIKTRRVDGAGHGGPAFLRREAAGLRTAATSGVAAELIDFDDDAGVAIQSDLGAWPTLHQLLIGDLAEAAARGMIDLATATARLHATTLDRRDDHQRVLDGFAADVSTGAVYAFGLEAWDEIERACNELALPPAAAARDDVAALLRRTTEPGDFGALIHLDLNPSNVLITDAGARLIDFEGCRYGHLGIDASFLRYPFPHHSHPWGVLPGSVIEEADAAYRAALGANGAAAVLDGYDRMIADGAAIPLIGRIRRLRLVADADQSAQDGRRRRGQIVHQIGVFGELADRAGGMGRLAAWLRALAAAIIDRWPDAVDPPPPLYPAFGQLSERPA